MPLSLSFDDVRDKPFGIYIDIYKYSVNVESSLLTASFVEQIVKAEGFLEFRLSMFPEHMMTNLDINLCLSACGRQRCQNYHLCINQLICSNTITSRGTDILYIGSFKMLLNVPPFNGGG